MMVFRFTGRKPACAGAMNFALEATFDNGTVIQSMYIDIVRAATRQRRLVYREGESGKWLSSEGISCNGLQRTPENLVRSIGGADPIKEIYVLPAM